MSTRRLSGFDPRPSGLDPGTVDESRCIHSIEGERIIHHHLVGPIGLSMVIGFVLQNYARWGRHPLLFDVSKALLGETAFDEWLRARDDLWPVAEARRGGRTAILSREPLHNGILGVFVHAAQRRRCKEHMKAFESQRAAEHWLLSPEFETGSEPSNE